MLLLFPLSGTGVRDVEEFVYDQHMYVTGDVSVCFAQVDRICMLEIGDS